MKAKWICSLFFAALFIECSGQSWIRINQLGYLPGSVKVAVFISTDQVKLSGFEVCDAVTDRTVFHGDVVLYSGEYWGMKSAARLNFSDLKEPGGYYIRIGKIQSEPFRIDNDVYNGTADYLLKYIRQQRCGYNPFLADSCHTHDGRIVDHPVRNGQGN